MTRIWLDPEEEWNWLHRPDRIEHEDDDGWPGTWSVAPPMPRKAPPADLTWGLILTGLGGLILSTLPPMGKLGWWFLLGAAGAGSGLTLLGRWTIRSADRWA